MTLPAGAIAALHEGRKIDAIKIVRSERNIQLKDAKDAVDTYIRSQPALEASLNERQAKATRTLLAWLTGIVLFLALAYLVTK